MSEPDQETADRRCLKAWRGLKAHVLDELDTLDRDAIKRGDRFATVRERNIESRRRCRELRAERDLDHMGHPLRPWQAVEPGEPY